jgi:hypothetical protein
MDIHKVIAALLAKTAENGATEAEAQAAADKAAALAIKHGIDMAKVRMAEGAATKIGVDECRIDDLLDREWERSLLRAVAAGMGGKVVTLSNGRDGAYVYGTAGNAEAIVELYFYLESALADISYIEAALQGPKQSSERELRHWRWSFRQGAARRIGERLLDQRERLEADQDNSKALVVIDEQLQKRIAEKHPHLTMVPARPVTHHGAAAAGRRAAEKIPLGESRVTTGRGQLPAA